MNELERSPAPPAIDEVVGFIRNIAGQPNLLGAQCHDRGGGARRGRTGLAVVLVASEVKGARH